MEHHVSCELGGRTLKIETGKLAKQAHGSVVVSYGDTKVLVTAVSSSRESKMDFFPLTVEYAEKYYAAGKIPGSFFRREARPTEEATLTARLIDRPIRPLFPDGYKFETQVVATVISLDPDFPPDICASIGASAALHISDIPFNGPTATCRVGRIGGNFVFNPTWQQEKSGESDVDILVTATANAIMMVEGGAKEVPESEVYDAIVKGWAEIKNVISIINELREKCGKPKREFTPPSLPEDIVKAVESTSKDALAAAFQVMDKAERYSALDKAKDEMLEKLIPESLKKENKDEAAKREKDAKEAFGNLKYTLMRGMILNDKKRIDGRDMTSVRPISTEVGLLPRAHGSALFTRGETQVLASITLGTSDDEQLIDSLYERGKRAYNFHYNFPPFSVGECGRMGTSRREIGHGALAGRAIGAMLPDHDKFPYTLRITCETLESNGSSSMGSVCSASMALMQAGVPFPKPVAGIAMGLIKEGDKTAILSDILGDEDHLGDMDFKVAGTKDGVTAIQMDIKIEGVNEEIMQSALRQAHEGRIHILGEMAKTIEAPTSDLSAFAPRITALKVPTDKIAIVIGPGGKMIKKIIAETGCKVDIDDDGTVHVASSDPEASKKAIAQIQGLVAEVEEGKVYKGIVKKIVDFGAFVGVLPHQDGLLHISEIAHERVNRVEDHLKEGDEIEVKVIEVDQSGKVRLSRRVLIDPPEGFDPEANRGGGGFDRGGRGGGGDRDGGGGRGGYGGGRGGYGGGRGGRGGGRGRR